MRRKNGFTIAEMMVSIVASVMLVGGVWLIYLMSMRSWAEGSRNAGLERSAGMVLERIVRGANGRFGIREADVGTVQVSVSGDSVTFMVDKQNPPTSWNSDDDTSRYYQDGTLAMYDPDTSVSGDELVLNRFGDVEQLLFSLNGEVLTAKIVLTADAPRTTSRRLVTRMQTDIFLRKRR
jgi:Tfp pilus assembly protein PilW